MLSDLERLEPEWEQLWQRDPRATPFQSPAWLIPWTRHLWGGGESLVLSERDEAGQLTALLPLFRWGTQTQCVSFLGAGVSDYGDQLGSFRKNTLPPDAVLEEVRSGSPILQRNSAEPCSVCPVLPLADYPGRLDPKLKVDLRRAQNRIAKSHQAQFSLASDPEVFFHLHALRWRETPDESLLSFQREVAVRFAERGMLRLHTLSIDDEPAAAIFAVAAHRTLYCYLTAFDPKFTKLSPGAILLAHALESAQSEGLDEADFLRGAESYKYLWGAQDRTNYRVRPRNE